MLDYHDKKEVHVSALIQKSATDCAREILGVGNEEEVKMSSRSWWGFGGDLIGRGISPDAPYREIGLSIPIGETGWVIAGTADAVFNDEDGVVIGEWKSHAFPRPEHVEKAYRQSALYLAMWWDSYQRGQRVFKVRDEEAKRVQAELEYLAKRYGYPVPKIDLNQLDFHCDDNMRPQGVNVRVKPIFPEQRISQGWALGNTLLQEFLDFYGEKAAAVVGAVEMKDHALAGTFDRKYPTEGFDVFEKIKDPPRAVKMLLAEKRLAAKACKVADKEHERIQMELAKAHAYGKLEPGQYELDEGISVGFRGRVSGRGVPYLKFYGDKEDVE